jgi:hypothetical protein
MLPTKLQFIWPSGFRGKEMINQKKELPVAAMFFLVISKRSSPLKPSSQMN